MPFLGKTPSQIVDPEVDIDGGTIDGVAIGSVTANAGAFTNLTATGTLTLPDDGISGDDVNGGTISNFASTGIDDNATSTAITIDSLGRTQIGTTSAYNSYADNLVVEDDSNAGITIATTDTSARTSLYFADGAVVGADQYRGIIEYRHSSDSMHFWTNATDHNIVVDNAGKVGIGTSPSNLLHVDKDTGSTPTVYINNSGADATDGAALKVQASGRGSGIADTSIFSVHNISDELFTVRNDGNVGIGTASPSTTLNVGHESHGVGIAYVSSLPNSAGIYTSSDASHGQAYGSLVVQARAEYSGYGILFRASNQERMRIDGSGNVSIGTSSTANALFKTDIKGSSTGNFQALRLFNSSDGASATTDLSFCLNRVGSEVLGVAGSIKAGKEQTWTTTPSTVDGYLSFSTVLDETPAERMRISSSGNVGIGSVGPSQKLHVEGGDVLIKSEYNATGTTDALIYLASRTSGNWRNAHIGQSGNALVFATGGTGTTHTNGTERVRIDGSGNLGIGTSNPARQLHVVGGIRFSSTGPDANRWNVYWNGSTGDLIVVSSDARLKEDFDYGIAGIETVKKLKPVRFTWKENNKRQLGFTAQESLEADEHLAWHDEENDQWGLDGWEGYAAVLTKAIQEQQAIIDSQASVIADLTTRLEALEAN